MPRRTRFAALLLASALVSPAALAQPKYPATVDVLGGIDGDGPGGGLELMAPFVEGEGSLLFGLARGTMWDETGAGGVGLGYRAQALPGFILGGYGMLDYHRGQSDEGYFQGVLGLEALTESFDFRINGYLPEDDETTLADATGASPALPPLTVGEVAIVGHEIGLVTSVTAGTPGLFRAFERPLPGVDAEIGYRLPLPGHDFRIFLGAFHFDHEDYESVTGPKARAEWRIHDLELFGNNSRLTLETGIRDDDVRGTDASAGVRIRIPFGGVPSNQRGHELAGLDQRMLDPIRREDHIVTGEREQSQAGTPFTVELEAVEAVETGNEITSIWFADGVGGGDGTMGNETELAGAVAGAGIGGLIVALGGNGDLTGNVTLATDQILLGGASTLDVKGVSSGTVLTYGPAGARPTIIDDGTGATAVVQLADGNLLAGFDTQSVSINILGNSVDDLIARDVSTGGLGSGMAIIGGTNIEVTGFGYRRTTQANNGFGLRLADVTGADLDQLRLENAQWGAMIFESSDIDVTGVTAINNATGLNLVSSTDVMVNGVEVSFAGPLSGVSGVRGIAISRDSILATIPSAIDISNVTVTGPATGGSLAAIDVRDATDVSVTGLDASDVLQGLSLTSVSGFTASDIDVTNASSTGVTITSSSDITVDDLTIAGLGTGPGTTTIGVQLQSSMNASFTNLDISDFHRGIFVTGGQNLDFTDAVMDNVNTGAILNGAVDVGITNATMTDVTGGVSVNASGAVASQDIRLINVDIAGRAGIIGASAGIQFFSVNGATLTDITVDNLAWGLRFFPAAGTVVQNVTGSNITVTNITSQQGIQMLNASNITINDFTIDAGIGDGIHIGGTSNNITIGNGTISDIAGRGILVDGTGATGAALSSIDISGIGTRAGVFHSGAGVTLTNNVTASFNQIDIDGQNSGGAMVGQYGFDFIDFLGQTQTVSGTGNTVVNVPNVCARNGTGTISGTVQVNGNPEPGTSC
jgi:hypothetical protein